MGITKVALPKYALGGIGMIPGTIIFVYFGTTVSNISDAASGRFDGGALQLVLLIVGSIFAVFAVFYVSYVARKEVKKVLAKTEAEKKRKERREKNGEDDGVTPGPVHNPYKENKDDPESGSPESQSNEYRAEPIQT